jgi:hypothetical protein
MLCNQPFDLRPYELPLLVPRNVREILKREEDPGQDTTFCRLERFFRVQLHFIEIFSIVIWFASVQFSIFLYFPKTVQGDIVHLEIICLVVRFLISLAKKLPLIQSRKPMPQAIPHPNFPEGNVWDVSILEGSGASRSGRYSDRTKHEDVGIFSGMWSSFDKETMKKYRKGWAKCFLLNRSTKSKPYQRLRMDGGVILAIPPTYDTRYPPYICLPTSQSSMKFQIESSSRTPRMDIEDFASISSPEPDTGGFTMVDCINWHEIIQSISLSVSGRQEHDRSSHLQLEK